LQRWPRQTRLVPNLLIQTNLPEDVVHELTQTKMSNLPAMLA
jgi:hypothetical protein